MSVKFSLLTLMNFCIFYLSKKALLGGTNLKNGPFIFSIWYINCLSEYISPECWKHFNEIEQLLLSVDTYILRGKSDKSLSNDKMVGIIQNWFKI